MEELIGELKAWGAAPKAGIRRMLGDEAFYLKLLKQFAEEKDWEELFLLVKQEAYGKAFVLAHRLKGSVVDLELHPIMEALSVVVEDLRGSAQGPLKADSDPTVAETLSADIERLQKKREELLQILSGSDQIF